MPRFTKKPVTIDAVKLTTENAGELVQWITSQGGEAWMRGGNGGGSKNAMIYLKTLESHGETQIASPGEWIIRGVKGEFYPIKEHIFFETYSPESESGSSVEREALRNIRECELVERALRGEE